MSPGVPQATPIQEDRAHGRHQHTADRGRRRGGDPSPVLHCSALKGKDMATNLNIEAHGLTKTYATAVQRVDALLAIASLQLAIHLATNGAYGFHTDELYFIVGGQHPALGY